MGGSSGAAPGSVKYSKPSSRDSLVRGPGVWATEPLRMLTRPVFRGMERMEGGDRVEEPSMLLCLGDEYGWTAAYMGK